jgi:hypothetical protein
LFLDRRLALGHFRLLLVASRLGPSPRFFSRFFDEDFDIRPYGCPRAEEFIPRPSEWIVFTVQLRKKLHQVGELDECFFVSCQRLLRLFTQGHGFG